MDSDLEKKKTQRTILSVVLGVAILACMIFLLYNQTSTLQEARAQVEQEELALQQEEARLLNLIALSKQASELEERKARAEALLPPLPKENTLITGMLGLGVNPRQTYCRLVLVKGFPNRVMMRCLST